LVVAAIGIAPLVGMPGEKALRQIAVSKMQLQPFETYLAGSFRRGDEIIAHTSDVVQGHFTRLLAQVFAESQCRRRQSLPATRIVVGDVVVPFPWSIGAGLAARMGNLNARYRALLFDGLHDGNECLGEIVIPDAGAARRNATFRRDSSCFDNDQTSPAARHAGVVCVVPLIGE